MKARFLAVALVLAVASATQAAELSISPASLQVLPGAVVPIDVLVSSAPAEISAGATIELNSSAGVVGAPGGGNFGASTIWSAGTDFESNGNPATVAAFTSPASLNGIIAQFVLDTAGLMSGDVVDLSIDAQGTGSTLISNDTGIGEIDYSPVMPVQVTIIPEPSTFALFGMVGLGLVAFRRRRR